MKLTLHEILLLKGMLRNEQNHASRCDFLQNNEMAKKQKAWDLERAALLEKIIKDGE